MSKEQWIAEEEAIIQRFIDENITLVDAIAELEDLGIDTRDSIRTMSDVIVEQRFLDTLERSRMG